MDGTVLVKGFERNLRILGMQLDGLSQPDSLIQAPYNVNCMNWTVGHIVRYRDEVLGLLGAEPIEPRAQRYANESDPITEDGPDVIAVEDLLDALGRQQDLIDGLLGGLDHDDLEIEVERDGRSTSLVRRLQFHLFHDTFHTGQTELLRQMSGKSDKVL